VKYKGHVHECNGHSYAHT